VQLIKLPASASFTFDVLSYRRRINLSRGHPACMLADSRRDISMQTNRIS